MNTVKDLSGKTLIVAITHDHTRIWALAQNGHEPSLTIQRPSDEAEHRHVREAQHNRGHSAEFGEDEYFSAICAAVATAPEFLLIGHAKGKANSAERFRNYLTHGHPTIAHRLAGFRNENLPHMTNGDVLNLGQRWFAVQHGITADVPRNT
jgi:hypothetical protein